MIVNVPLFGQHQIGLSKTASNETTVNFYFETINGQNILHGTPGLTEFADTGGAENRGHGEFANSYYVVNGQTLYTVTSGGAVSSIGTIDGTGQCKLVDTGTHLVITTGATTYAYSGTSLTTISGLNSPSTAAYLNQRTYYDGAGGQFQAGSLADPTTINGLDIATAESAPDDTLAVDVFKMQYMLIFGQKTVEPWYNSGTGSPPVDRINGSLQPYGLAAIHSIAQNSDFIYFLSHEREPVRMNGLSVEKIGTPSIVNEWRAFATVDDAIGFCYSLNGMRFYEIVFPTENKSYAFQEGYGWIRLKSGSGRHKANGAHYIYNKWLTPDYSNGKIYEIDLDTYTDDGETIIRERSTVHLYAGLVGQQFEGREVVCNWLELVLEPGMGLASGQGENPQVMLQWSDDGKTWSSELWRSAGVMGDYKRRVIWEDLGAFVNRQFRFKVSDPVKWSFIRLSADVEIGI